MVTAVTMATIINISLVEQKKRTSEMASFFFYFFLFRRVETAYPAPNAVRISNPLPRGDPFWSVPVKWFRKAADQGYADAIEVLKLLQ